MRHISYAGVPYEYYKGSLHRDIMEIALAIEDSALEDQVFAFRILSQTLLAYRKYTFIERCLRDILILHNSKQRRCFRICFNETNFFNCWTLDLLSVMRMTFSKVFFATLIYCLYFDHFFFQSSRANS